jgi:hypothetical protein
MRRGLYIAAVLGAAFATFVGLIGISQHDAVVIGQSVVGLCLFGAVALLTSTISTAKYRRAWIVLIAALTLVVAAGGGVTGLLGYSPAIATLAVVLTWPS